MTEWSLRAIEIGVGDIDRSIAFYEGLLGLALHDRGQDHARLGGARPFLALRRTGVRRDPAAAGLFHTAIRYADRAALGQVMQRVEAAGWHFSGAADHLVSEALYLDDPDGNGVELYHDRPARSWRWHDGQIEMANAPLDRAGILAAASRASEASRDSGSIELGHVHLESLDLDGDEAMLVDALSLAPTLRWPRARFLAWDGYHHHIAINNWSARHSPLAKGSPAIGVIKLLVGGPAATSITTRSGLAIEIQSA